MSTLSYLELPGVRWGSHKAQEQQMKMLKSRHGANFTRLLDTAFETRGFPREEQHWEKFKALLALPVGMWEVVKIQSLVGLTIMV